MSSTKSRCPKRLLIAVVGGFLSLGIGCDGSDGTAGTPGARQPDRNTLDPWEDLPGLVIKVLELQGGSGPGGKFRVGDSMSVKFTVQNKGGKDLPLEALNYGGIMVSGPSFNYQRVLPRARDLITASRAEDGTDPVTYTYTFADPIPAVYAPPENDTASFGLDDGELQGEALLDGTYTVGIEAYKSYTVRGTSYRDAANVTKDFLFGNADTLDLREVTRLDNCNQCHTEVRAHGTFRRDLKLCLLCHTAGAEDKNVAKAAGGTPGVSIDFRVMIHRIHNGGHLPSVLGVATKADGTRDYQATPKPYKVVGFGDRPHDYSHVTFPVWPGLGYPLPRDNGYSALSSTARSAENAIRSGAASCGKCHGDPDGNGPLKPPAQGGFAFSKPSRVACGSCHDDIDWDKPYVANLLTMPPQANDDKCLQCHPASGSILGTAEGHLHPLNNPKLNRGLTFQVTAVSESGTNNRNGKLDPGEKLRISFTMKDQTGSDVKPADIARLEAVVVGPRSNRNILLEARFPTAALTGSSVTTHLPERVFLDFLGDSTAAGGEEFTSSRTPHWTKGATTTVWARTATTGGDDTLSAAASALQNFLDVADATGFDRGDYIVVDDGVAGKEEYLRIQWVNGKRLWFSSGHGTYDQPWMRVDHGVGARVQEVTLTKKTATTDYTLEAATGKIKEVTEFGAGNAVLVSYTTDFMIPKVYPPAINESPDLDETWGEWTGKSLVDGTYEVGVWGEVAVTLKYAGETNNYSGTSRPAIKPFLIGSATKIVSEPIISSAANCYACHEDMYFHGGHRRGYETCLLCHGTAGSEDRPRYVAANAPDTTGVSIDFRDMLHKIHHGKELTNASTYTVVGFGSRYPNNFSAHTYGKVGFPAMSDGTKNCSACHGAGNPTWVTPTARDHPTEQGNHARTWRVVCGSCHDSTSAIAHIDLQTTAKGAESCATCHGSDKENSVELAHKRR